MRLYSTSSRRKEELPPPPGPIGMYFCGPTLYTRIHVGNARPFIVSAWLKRWLELNGYVVTLVENLTDINDKIYDAAPGASAQLARDATQWYFKDTDDLRLGRPDHEPSAEQTIPEQIALIEELIAGGFAYEVDGDVYFRVARFPEYGRLSNQRLDQLAEQEPNPRKEDQRDFALWKAHKPEEDTWWDSPWGRGRPGWHIECSAMAEKHLGPSFEIHGGGLDLVFPHHENEIAQSRAAGREFARIWMHNGMLGIRGEEMHKSLGNAISLRDVLDRWGRDALLVFYLRAHWRKPVDYDDELMAQAQAEVETFRNVFRTSPPRVGATAPWEAFEAALDDDFNTPEALAILHSWRAHGHTEWLERGLTVFGLENLATEEAAPHHVHELASRRLEARNRKSFEEADTLRDEIEQAGWEVRDVADDPGYQLVPRP
jgi:cysteinyl-tRNA synthetase